ncbi:MAG: PDZ domain-containing protein [Actinobacteria bacterium]|nr:PDZ domain-containing protein [Actinomycetota bacterium]NCU89842.1 PDZ domain-containing protein [Actinomycetota bacterium]
MANEVPHVPEKTPRKRKIGSARKSAPRKKSSDKSVADFSFEKDIRTNSKSVSNAPISNAPISNAPVSTSPISNTNTSNETSRNPDLLRRIVIVAISGSLLFGAGVQIGSQRGNSTVDQAIETIIDSGAKDLDRAVLERAAIEGALKASGDEWANYFPKSALDVLEEQSSNVFTGVGIWLNKTRGGQIQISSIQENSPAATSGLSVGDQILEVNGTDVRGASLTSVIAIIRGDIGKRIELLVSRNEKRILASLSTEKVALSTVEASQVGTNVALVQVASFSRGTADEVQKSLSQLKYSSGIILDLRNNPGGLLEEALRVSQLFIGNGVIVSYQVNGAEKLFKAVNPNPVSVPVVVMINRNTASSAEIVASAFQDRNRGVIIGERSYGKGSVQEFVTLEDGSKLELTVARYVTPSGKIIDEVGVSPDLEVSSREINIKALQILGGLASLSTKK